MQTYNRELQRRAALLGDKDGLTKQRVLGDKTRLFVPGGHGELLASLAGGTVGRSAADRDPFRDRSGNLPFPSPQSRGAPKRSDMNVQPKYTLRPKQRIPAGTWASSGATPCWAECLSSACRSAGWHNDAAHPPPDYDEWPARDNPGPGAYAVRHPALHVSTTNFAPGLHWPDGDLGAS